MAAAHWIRYVCVLIMAGSTDCLRVHHSANVNARMNTSVSVAAGTALRGRYVLESRLYLRDLNPRRKDGRPSRRHPKVGRDFPISTYFQKIPKRAEINNYAHGDDGHKSRIHKSRMSGPQHLGTGSFGDVWKAYDVKRKQYVAVKLFYTYDESSRSYKYLTPALAKKGGSDYGYVRGALQECQDVIELMKQESVDPKGAKRICQCFDEHVSDAKALEPFFLVFEMCGTALDEIYEQRWKQKDAPENTPAWVRRVITEVLQGINFLSSVKPPKVHHDLKLENVVVSNEGHVKLIDFGAMQEFEASAEDGVCTPQYTPPEVMCAQGPSFRFPGRPYEFDVYSTGLMYWELACNHRPGWEDDSTTIAGYRIKAWIPKNKTCRSRKYAIGTQDDFKIINDLMHENPDRRASPEKAIKALSAIPQNRKLVPSFAGRPGRFLTRATESSCARKPQESCEKDCEWKDGSCHIISDKRSRGHKGRKRRRNRVQRGTERRKDADARKADKKRRRSSSSRRS